MYYCVLHMIRCDYRGRFKSVRPVIGVVWVKETNDVQEFLRFISVICLLIYFFQTSSSGSHYSNSIC